VPDWLIALIFGFVAILVGVPLLALLFLSVFDVLARLDIGISKLVWLGVVLMIPVAGALLYWLLRPKDFDPYEESERPTYLVAATPSPAFPETRQAQPAMAAPARMTPALQGGADPEPEQDSEPAA
jgi:hypothetical protein